METVLLSSVTQNSWLDNDKSDLCMTTVKLKKENAVKYATWNVRSVIHKEEELDTTFKEQNTDTAVTTETKKKLQGTKETQNYTLIGINAKTHAQAGVMIWIHNSLRNKILQYTYWNERILEVRLKLSRGNLTILGLHAPEGGHEEDNDELHKQLQDIYNKLNKNDYIILAGDLNARVSNKSINKNISTFGEQTVNKNVTRLIDFAVYNN
jgi:exonuclease III